MSASVARLTVMFEEPFWIGLYEREEAGRYEVSRVVFGAEPKDYEVWDMLLNCWSRLKFSPSLEGARIVERRVNPKRMQRLINKQLANTGVGTKAQQALAALREEGALARKTLSRERREAEKTRKFELRQEKKKEKRKGH